jgi:hypothetical protein
MQEISQLFQIVVALGLLNVWLLRFNKPTEYRGGQASSMRQEFATYGLPEWFCYLVGFLKVTSAFCLLAGFLFPSIVIYPAVVVSVLMVGALGMHLKVKDPIKKSIPAFSVLLMCLIIIASRLNN